MFDFLVESCGNLVKSDPFSVELSRVWMRVLSYLDEGSLRNVGLSNCNLAAVCAVADLFQLWNLYSKRKPKNLHSVLLIWRTVERNSFRQVFEKRGCRESYVLYVDNCSIGFANHL